MSEETPSPKNLKKLLFIGIPVLVVLIASALVFSFVSQSNPNEAKPNAIPTLSDLSEEELLESPADSENSDSSADSGSSESPDSDASAGEENPQPATTPALRAELSEETLATIALTTTEPFENPLQEESFFNDNPYRVYVLGEETSCPTDNTNYKFYQTTIQETAIYPTIQDPNARWGEFVEVEEETPICIRETLGELNVLTNLTPGSEVPGRILVEVIADTNEECLNELQSLEPNVDWTVIKIDNEYGFCTGLAVMLSEEKIVEIENSDNFISAERDTVVSIQ